MLSFNKVTNELKKFLINDLSSNELIEYYKVLNTKYIATIGTVENNFSYDKQEQEKLKGIIEDVNLIFKNKYNAIEVDLTTKFNALLKEYLKLQEAYITKEVASNSLIITTKKVNIIKNIGTLRRTLTTMLFIYFNEDLDSITESFLNSTIKYAVKELTEEFDFFSKCRIPCLNYFEGIEEVNVPFKEAFNVELAEVMDLIAEFNELKSNPFKQALEMELNIIEDIYSGSKIQEEKEKILNNVPEYDFSSFELILPEVDSTEEGVKEKC